MVDGRHNHRLGSLAAGGRGFAARGRPRWFRWTVLSSAGWTSTTALLVELVELLLWCCVDDVEYYLSDSVLLIFVMNAVSDVILRIESQHCYFLKV